MNKDGTGRRRAPGKFLRSLAAVMLLTVLTAGTLPAKGAGMTPDPLDLLLAQDAAAHMKLTAPDGSALEVRSDPSVQGRGAANPDGSEPDYIGMVGYAVLPLDPEISQTASFQKAYWTIPLYRRAKDGSSVIPEGSKIPHKTPVIVTKQELEPDGEDGYKGYLEIIRLDVRMPCMLDVACFVTTTYWNLPIPEIADYGYSLAVYRETPGEGPRETSGDACILRDGTRVLIPYTGACDWESPSPEILTVQGVVFLKEDGQTVAHTVYFRADDLIFNY